MKVELKINVDLDSFLANTDLMTLIENILSILQQAGITKTAEDVVIEKVDAGSVDTAVDISSKDENEAHSI